MEVKPKAESIYQVTNNSPPPSRRWLKLFLKTGSAIGLGLFLLLIVGIGFGQWWAKNNLASIVDRELTKSLKRPINLGKIEDIWFNSVYFSNANIPANGSDLNRLAAPQVIISFNPFQLAFDRTLKLDIHLVNPDLNIFQNSQGNWINIPKQDKTPASPIKIEVGTVKIDDAQLVIVPYSKNPQPVTVSKVNVQAELTDSQDRVDFRGGARFGESGQVQFNGNSLIANGKTQLVAKGQKLDAVAATRIIKIPQVEAIQGTVDGDLTLVIEPQKSLRINSNLLVRDGKIAIDRVPRSLDEINGFMRISERGVQIDNVTAKYDRIAGLIDGNLNFNTGYQISAKTAPIAITDVLKSLDIKSPFALAGAAVAQLQLTGKLDSPVLTGKFNNSQPSQIDRVQIDRLNGNFRLADGRIKLDAVAQPQLGGTLTAQGEIQLLKTPQTRFQVQGDRLPGDALLRLYGAKLPSQVKIGASSVQGTILQRRGSANGGTGADIYTNLRVNAPQATYPVSADLQITPQGSAIVRSATFAVAGGKVTATGDVTKTNWRLNLQPQNLDTQKLAKIGGINLPVNYGGKLGGSIEIAGLNNDAEIDRVQAKGKLSVQLAAGKVTANNFNVDRGKWQANISSNALNLQQIVQTNAREDNRLPTGTVSGNFNLSGT